jgi:Protein of unknown function (DUF3054)
MAHRDRFFPWILLAGDLLVLAAFVVAGQREHEMANPNNPFLGVLLTTGEFAAAWLVAASWFGALLQDDPPSLRSFMSRSLSAWLMAAPLGVLVRALVLGRADIPTAFLIVVLGLCGALLLGWRLLFAIGWTRMVQR